MVNFSFIMTLDSADTSLPRNSNQTLQSARQPSPATAVSHGQLTGPLSMEVP